MVSDDKKMLWERYKHDVELHRSYLDLVIKINALYYAITGAIVSFYFLHIGDDPLVKWSLLLPILMSIFLAYFFWRSADASRPSQAEIERVSEELGFQVPSAVAAVLELLLKIFFCLFVLVSIGLIILLFKDFKLCGYIK
ncbi:MAG: hypothetical protein DHS20C02_10230 [Micavibrio sp.]|nr:MAG: hypothetical protein DHS20C02_10230 [Micavibrio sp.]